jgi:tetratricopeptide (TPR) repeat protein
MADQGRLDELKRKFEENPKRYFAPLANEYRKAGDPELAIELCRTYLPQQPTHMSGYIVYGQALHDAGQTDESAAVFKQALTLDPENIIALRHLGDISRDAGDNVGAMRWYGKVLELDPRNEEIAAYIASLAQPGRTAPSPAAPERPAPPSVRPEPAHDESAVRLEDIVSEPDVAQSPRMTESDQNPRTRESPGVAASSTASDEAGAAALFLSVEQGDDVLQVAYWPSAPQADESAPVAAVDASQPLDGPWHAGTPPHEPSTAESLGMEEQVGSLNLSDFMPEEDAAFAPTAEELGEQAPEKPPEHESAPAPHADSEPASWTGDRPDAQPARGEKSPFVTETMAELYLQQGLHGEALVIYRQLALKRDDPALRRRIAELESKPSATTPVESAREFFARIGAMKPRERVVLAADRTSTLSALFGSAEPSQDDITAAQRLSGAFGDPQSRTSDS